MNKPPTPRRFRCRIGFHCWEEDWDDENGRQRCPECGRYFSRSVYYGTWALVVSIIVLLFALASKCSGEVVAESGANFHVDGFGNVWSVILIDTTTGSRVLVTESCRGLCSVLLPPRPSKISYAPPPKDDGRERTTTWADNIALSRLSKDGWIVDEVIPGPLVNGLTRYIISRPKAIPGMVELPMKGKP